MLLSLLIIIVKFISKTNPVCRTCVPLCDDSITLCFPRYPLRKIKMELISHPGLQPPVTQCKKFVIQHSFTDSWTDDKNLSEQFGV